jgi:hypothetical protein
MTFAFRCPDGFVINAAAQLTLTPALCKRHKSCVGVVVELPAVDYDDGREV